MTRVLCSMLISSIIQASAAGQSHQKQDPCANAQTTAEIAECAGKEYKKADSELNKVYRQLMEKLDDPGHKSALKESEVAWLKYRDSNCDFESYLNRGGTIYPIVNTGCRTRMTQARTSELKEMLKED